MELITALENAKVQKENLESIYNQVTEPRVIDSIIHQIIVAEDNYNRLLEMAREQNLSIETIEMR